MGCAVWWIGFKFLDGCGVGEPDFSRGVMELEDEEDVRMGLRESGLSWSDMRGYFGWVEFINMMECIDVMEMEIAGRRKRM